jgi:hypothetical protein
MMTRTMRWLTAALFALWLTACGSRANWSGDPARIEEIKAGMSQAEVIEILGEPPTVIDEELMAGVRLVIWEYQGADDRLTITFHPEDGTVAASARNGEYLIEPSM